MMRAVKMYEVPSGQRHCRRLIQPWLHVRKGNVSVSKYFFQVQFKVLKPAEQKKIKGSDPDWVRKYQTK